MLKLLENKDYEVQAKASTLCRLTLSLLLLLFPLSTLFALLGEELALCLEPLPAALNVPCSFFHRHLLLELRFLSSCLSLLLFFTPLTLFSVQSNLRVDSLDFLRCLVFAVFDLVAFVFDASDFSLALSFLFLVLHLQ